MFYVICNFLYFRLAKALLAGASETKFKNSPKENLNPRNKHGHAESLSEKKEKNTKLRGKIKKQ